MAAAKPPMDMSLVFGDGAPPMGVDEAEPAAEDDDEGFLGEIAEKIGLTSDEFREAVRIAMK